MPKRLALSITPAVANHAEPYWLGVILPAGLENDLLDSALRRSGMIKPHDEKGCYLWEVKDEEWETRWESLQALLIEHQANDSKIALLPCRTEPSVSEVTAQAQPLAIMREVTQHLWLLEALAHRPIEPHFQPVVDSKRQKIGYESLARIANQQGTMMQGEKIIAASHALNIQHIVDRYLHSRSVEEFTDHHMSGKLFVNLVPGFVRKPSFYFDALTGAAYAGKLSREDIVLDITTVEQVKDTQHLEKIAEQAQEAGFSVALDDLSNLTDATRLIDLLRPEYAKLNQKLVQRFCEGKDQGEMKKIIAVAEDYGCILVAVGVETEAQFTALKSAGITLFQGYLFGKAEAARKA